MTPSKYLVTGGAGFIGSNLVRFLLDKGQHVVVLDDFSRGKQENIDELFGTGRLHLIRGDIRNAAVVSRAMEDCRAVFHLAAFGSIPLSVADPIVNFDVNVNGTLTVLESARKCGIKRIVFASSASVYGGASIGPASERLAIFPTSPYAASKATCEAYLKAYATTYGMETVPLRYFNIFGPRQDDTQEFPGVVPSFIKNILEGVTPVIYGDGNQTRDFCHVENACIANWLAANAPAHCCDGNPVNVGCGESYTVNDILTFLKNKFGSGLNPRHEATRAGDVYHTTADISLIRDKFGYEPQVGFCEGLEATATWYGNRFSNK